MTRSRCRGQAAVEALALMPLLVLAVVLVWQLVLLVNGALVAFGRVGAQAMSARGQGTVAVRQTVTIPSLLPGVGRLQVRVRAAVRAP